MANCSSPCQIQFAGCAQIKLSDTMGRQERWGSSVALKETTTILLQHSSFLLSGLPFFLYLTSGQMHNLLFYVQMGF